MSEPNPLTEHALGELKRVAESPVPTLEINAGVMRRFLQGRLVEIVDLKSPFKSHAGGNCPHAKITDAGLAELGLKKPSPPKRRKKAT